MPSKNTTTLVLGKSAFRSHPSRDSYIDYIIAEKDYEQETKQYDVCSRDELHVFFPNQKGRYSIEWKKHWPTLNNPPKIEKIIFRLKPSNIYSENISSIYGINFISQDKEIKNQAKIKSQKTASDISIRRNRGKWYEIDYHPATDQNGDISVASKKYMNDIANIFSTNIITDKDAVTQYQLDISNLHYFHFHTINDKGKSFYLHRFFKEEDRKSIPQIPVTLKKLISTFCY